MICVFFVIIRGYRCRVVDLVDKIRWSVIASGLDHTQAVESGGNVIVLLDRLERLRTPRRD